MLGLERSDKDKNLSTWCIDFGVMGAAKWTTFGFVERRDRQLPLQISICLAMFNTSNPTPNLHSKGRKENNTMFYEASFHRICHR